MFTGASTSFAKSHTTTPASNENSQDLNKIAQEKYKQDLRAYLLALDLHEERRREINLEFERLMEKALKDVKSSSKPSPSQMQKGISAAVKQRIIISATALRDSAMQSLGLPPIAPTPPPKLERLDKSKR